jgi:hypothetical protein
MKSEQPSLNRQNYRTNGVSVQDHTKNESVQAYIAACEWIRLNDPPILLHHLSDKQKKFGEEHVFNHFMQRSHSVAFPGEEDCISADQFMTISAYGSAVERVLRALRLAKIGQTIVVAKKHQKWISLAWFRSKVAEQKNNDDEHPAERSLTLNFTIAGIAELISEIENLKHGEEIQLVRSKNGSCVCRFLGVISIKHLTPQVFP